MPGFFSPRFPADIFVNKSWITFPKFWSMNVVKLAAMSQKPACRSTCQTRSWAEHRGTFPSSADEDVETALWCQTLQHHSDKNIFLVSVKRNFLWDQALSLHFEHAVPVTQPGDCSKFLDPIRWRMSGSHILHFLSCKCSSICRSATFFCDSWEDCNFNCAAPFKQQWSSPPRFPPRSGNLERR